MATSMKAPPVFDEETNYENYKKEVDLWKILVVKDLDANQLGPALFRGIKVRKAKDKVLELASGVIGAEGGIDKILKKLDELYEIEKDQKIYLALEDFESFRREKQESLVDFVSAFENKHNKIKAYECVLPDGVLTYKLLKAANLSKSQEQLCIATMQKWEYKEMIKQLKAVFNNIVRGNDNKETPAIKIEPINLAESMEAYCNIPEHQQFYEDEESVCYDDEEQTPPEDTYYQKNFSPYQRFSKKPQSQNRFPEAQNPYRYPNPRVNQNPFRNMMNARDNRGNIQKCSICKSIMHFASDCPHNLRNQSKPINQPIRHRQTQNMNLVSNVNEILFQSTSPLKFEEMACFPAETIHIAIIDCGATSTVMGEENYKNFKETLSEDEKIELEQSEVPSNIPFKFGYNPIVYSHKKAVLPVVLNGVECKLQTEIVNKPIPLLMSKPSMKKANTKINLMDDSIEMFGIVRPMIQTNSGHYGINIRGTDEIEEGTNISPHLQLLIETEKETDKSKIAKKLHSTLGHPKSLRVIDTLKASGCEDRELFDKLKELDTKCEVCMKWGRPHPKPIVSLPLANTFNETVALDLKVYINNKIYFLHLIDHATRFSQAEVIRSKSQETIVNAIFTKWIGLFGRPRKFLTDNGGEFLNESFSQMCYKLGINMKTTGAEAPWSNGLCERHNAILGEAVSKVIEETGVSVEIALAWAVAAKNAIHNIYGFSPYQLVIGKNPVFPSILEADLPQLEDSTSIQIVAQHLNALHSARKAFVEAESSHKLKRAMKAKTRTHSNTIYCPRDRVFYKKPDIDQWRGPAVVLGQDGTVVLVKDGGFLYRVHTSRLRLIEDNSINKENEDSKGEVKSKFKDTKDSTVYLTDEEPDEFSPGNVVEDEEISDENDINRIQIGDEIEDEIEEVETDRIYRSTKAKELPEINTTVQYRKIGEEDWSTLKILSKAGKAGGVNWHYRNVHCIDSNRDMCVSFKEAEWKKAENILIATSKSQAYEESRKVELQKFKELDIYEEVENEGQRYITLKWVDKEKETNGIKKKKSRLVARGFEEIAFNESKDSPTCQKESLRITFALAASKGFEIDSIDIMSAFLQGKELERSVYVLPPKEAGVVNKLWKLKRALYGLIDASLHWYKRVSEELQNLGLKISSIDPAVFYELEDDCLNGLILAHVDDLIIAGYEKFNTKLITAITEKFKISKKESTMFKYIGLQIEKQESNIYIHQTEYINELAEIELSNIRKQQIDQELSKEEKLKLKISIGQINWLATQTCPHISYEVCTIATQQKTATVRTILQLNKLIRKVKSSDMYLKYPNLDLQNLQILCYCDASYNSLPDGGSQGGMVILLTDTLSSCPIAWFSKRTKRVARNALSAETIAVGEGTDYANNIRIMLQEILPEEAPTYVQVFSDSRSLVDTSSKHKPPLDRSIRSEIASIREKIKYKEITLNWVSTKFQFADILTKHGVNAEMFCGALKEGSVPQQSDENNEFN